MAILIPLTKNLTAVADDDMEQSLSTHLWTVNRGYACRMDYSNGKGALIYMARLIMDAPEGVDVDHINGNSLDNRRVNLRLATRQQNSLNKGIHRRNSSGYVGVCWVKRLGRWQASIKVEGKQIHLGYFELPREASDAYQKAALKHFGDFRRDAVSVPEPVITKVCERPALTSKNTSGMQGISFDNGRKRWLAYIRLNQKTIRLGRFKTQEEAVAARHEAVRANPTAT